MEVVLGALYEDNTQPHLERVINECLLKTLREDLSKIRDDQTEHAKDNQIKTLGEELVAKENTIKPYGMT